jgi:hypothetical protein
MLDEAKDSLEGVCCWLLQNSELLRAEGRYKDTGMLCLAWVLPGGTPFPVVG